ncbi:MAG: hypothetical protein BV458_03435 [Thermoplasmata archaeon M9B2D]|nr:MAG: hypothetical protein BV458_03435 [Thermoplasmata archaeon M9B2D]
MFFSREKTIEDIERSNAEYQYMELLKENKRELLARNRFVDTVVQYFNEWVDLLGTDSEVGELLTGHSTSDMMFVRFIVKRGAYKHYHIPNLECTKADTSISLEELTDIPFVHETFVPELNKATSFGCLNLREKDVQDFYMGLVAECMLQLEKICNNESILTSLYLDVYFEKLDQEDYEKKSEELRHYISLKNKKY